MSQVRIKHNLPGEARTERFVLLSLVLALLTGCQSSGTGQNVDGVQLFQQGQPQAAVSRFQQAIVEDPGNADAYYNLASCYNYLGKQNSDPKLMQQAESVYHQCLDLNPNHVACHRSLAVLLVDTERPQSAFTLLERWAARSPQISDSRVELARLHEEFGENDRAQQYLTQAIEIDPNNSRAWAALARLREESGDYAQALHDYQRSYALNQMQPGVSQRIASLQGKVQTGGGWSTNGTRTVQQTPQGWTQR